MNLSPWDSRRPDPATIFLHYLLKRFELLTAEVHSVRACPDRRNCYAAHEEIRIYVIFSDHCRTRSRKFSAGGVGLMQMPLRTMAVDIYFSRRVSQPSQTGSVSKEASNKMSSL
jgi:hypothetical protein